MPTRKTPTPSKDSAARPPASSINDMVEKMPEREKAPVRRALENYKEREARPTIKYEGNRAVLAGDEGMRIAAHIRLMDLFGTASEGFMCFGVDRLSGSAYDADGKVRETAVNAALAMIAAIDPQDEIEGALALQMAQGHQLATTMLEMAARTDSTDHLALYGGLAVKLSRTFTQQIEALSRLRGDANQSVRVEHVHVHDGGQAIVGNVGAPGRGGRGKRKNRGQSDATDNSGRQPALRSPDPEGNAVPIARRRRKEAVPHARRD